MALRSVVPRLVKLGLKLGLIASFVAPLVTRVLIGYMFYQTGSGKLKNPETPIAFFERLGIPFPEANAAFVSRAEYYGGIAILAGVATRPAALLLSSTMVVALVTAHKQDVSEIVSGWWNGPRPAKPDEDATAEPPSLADLMDPGKVAAFPPLMFLLWLLFYGPGWLSLDAIVKAVARRQGWLAKLGVEEAPAAQG